jgi:hypothetical protein
VSELVRVCEVLANLSQYSGRTVAVVGRYSFRESGRYLGEDACESGAAPGTFAWPRVLKLSLDPKDAPKLPDPFDLDGAAADRKLKLIRKTTALGKFRFGSIEYDRWAIVYGRVERSLQPDLPPPGSQPAKSGLEPAPARLLYRGDGLIFFVAGE